MLGYLSWSMLVKRVQKPVDYSYFYMDFIWRRGIVLQFNIQCHLVYVRDPNFFITIEADVLAIGMLNNSQVDCSLWR